MAAGSDSTTPENCRLHVFFSGMVQGVGFRYTAASVAREFAVAGWVRNCHDGRVELTVEGKAPELERFLVRLSEEMSGYITNTDRNWQIATGEWSGFHIAPTE